MNDWVNCDLCCYLNSSGFSMYMVGFGKTMKVPQTGQSMGYHRVVVSGGGPGGTIVHAMDKYSLSLTVRRWNRKDA